jgi:hypothetical protein
MVFVVAAEVEAGEQGKNGAVAAAAGVVGVGERLVGVAVRQPGAEGEELKR